VIILDTNVLSALMKPAYEVEAARFLDRQRAGILWTTTITVFEVHLGIEGLAPSRKRATLETAFEHVLRIVLEDQVLSFDLDASVEAARIMAARGKSGRTVDIRDTMIAGIAVSRQASIATRNVRHFDDLPVSVIDPWQQ